MSALPAPAYEFREPDDAASRGPGSTEVEMVTRRALIGLGIAGGVLAAAGGTTAYGYSTAMARARALVSPSLSRIIPTRFGDLEYAEAGSGLPFLAVHGTGGGFDQGLFFSRHLVEAGYRVIAPSRFGYLRSSFPADPSPQNQADALVDLLDALGIDRVAISGVSAGAVPALAFAIKYPDRCAALLPIVPAAYVPRDEEPHSVPPWQMDMALTLLRSDFLFWAAIATAPNLLTKALLATDPALVRAASPAEQERAKHLLDSILPVSERAQGLINDNWQSTNLKPMPVETIGAPTLTISYADDGFGTAEAAAYLGRTIPGARVHIYPDGGHIGVGHDAESFALITGFLKEIGYS